jgi:hypothetical protein
MGPRCERFGATIAKDGKREGSGAENRIFTPANRLARLYPVDELRPGRRSSKRSVSQSLLRD